jgi:hypothetical protein
MCTHKANPTAARNRTERPKFFTVLSPNGKRIQK